MTSTLRQKAVSGMGWSFVEFFLTYILDFVVGIILARILSPKEFGVVGLMYVFISMSNVFIDSGFRQSLIRKQKCTHDDYCTAFYTNIFISILAYIIVFLSAGAAARYFHEPQIETLLKYSAISILFFAVSLVPEADMFKRMQFKSLAVRTTVSSVVGAIVGITMALMGFGIWSLVIKTLVQNLVRAILLWGLNPWRPSLTFSTLAFREMFSFSYKLMLSGLIDKLYQNIYNIVIAKCFSTSDLGYYSRAKRYSDLPASTLNSTIQRVSYPLFSKIQNDDVRLKTGYKQTIKVSMFVSFVSMFVLAASADSLVIGLVGQKWRPSILLLQLLCFSSVLLPMHSINLNMLKIKGRSDLFLYLDIIKKILAIPVIAIGILFGIIPMLWGTVALGFFGYFINSHWTTKLLNYPSSEQILDVGGSFLIASAAAIPAYFLGVKLFSILPYHLLVAAIQCGFALGTVIVISSIVKHSEYLILKAIFFERLSSLTTKFSRA